MWLRRCGSCAARLRATSPDRPSTPMVGLISAHNAWHARGLRWRAADECTRLSGLLWYLSAHEPTDQDRHPAFHLSARLSVGLPAGFRGDRWFHDRPGALLQDAE